MNRLEVDRLTFRERGPYTFTVDGGCCLGLQGASGAGKTLLLRAIADLDPHGGSVRLGNMICAEVPAPLWRKRVALLSAESAWWRDRVAPHFQDFSTLSEEHLGSLGFGSEVGEWQVSRLSSGEKQRLALLRVLENRPGALLLDEPTASLDVANIERVEQLLLAYGREHDVPLLWVSHDPEQLTRVSVQCLWMGEDGELSEP